MLLTGDKNLDMKILNELEDVDLIKMCQMNKAADAICTDQGFWLNRIMKKFPYLSLEMLNRYKQGRNWSEYYIEDLIQINPNNANDKLIENARRGGRLDLIIVSLNNNADIHYSDYSGPDAAVRNAVGYGDLYIVKYLIENGADIRGRDNEKLVTLASMKGNLEMVKYLAEHGGNLHNSGNVLNGEEGAAVRWASQNGHLEIVKYLVEHDVNFRSKNDYAVKWAKSMGHDDIVDYLVSQGAPRPR